MKTCAILEQPGKWRSPAAMGMLLFAALPAFIILAMACAGHGADPWTRSFIAAIRRSLLVAIWVAGISMALGFPAGMLTALYNFPLRRILLGLAAIPLFVPSFLWAIGLSMLRIQLGLPAESFLSGASGSVMAFAALNLPLVLYGSFAATRSLSRGQIDALRLSGDAWLLCAFVAKSVFPTAAIISLFGAILTLSDPGPGQILGFPGMAAEILTSFSSFYDFAMAAKQCAILSGIVFMLVFPLLKYLSPFLTAELFSRDVSAPPLFKSRGIAILETSLLLGLICTTIILPLAGFLGISFHEFPLARAMKELHRTLFNTFFYPLSAGLLAAAMGLIICVSAGREKNLRRNILIGLCLLFTLPPSLSALGLIHTAAQAPAALDFLLRSRLTVCLALGLRFLPIAVLLGMRRFGASSPSWVHAGALHGVSWIRYFFHVLLPWLLPACGVSFLLTGLLSSAEVGTVLLLRPPGADSLPVSLFTVMANAPESLVAALCLLYVFGASGFLGLGYILIRKCIAWVR